VQDPEDLRSVTIVVLLSDPSAYTGAHFEARFDGHSGRATRVPLPRAGDAIGFPSKYLWHRVTKCTSGMRESLVFWAKRPGVIAPRFAIDDDDEDAGAPSPDGLS
jgi:predicted 2-oxoglutarate/Fe(II)-dependent dioxygenase YbiX